MDELGNSLAEGEAFIEAETNTKNPRHGDTCLNCGTKLFGAYCHKCGQKDIPRRQVIGDLVSNFIEAFTNFDGKFLRTTKYLFLRPGFLTVEYNTGKRETYFHPVRMYTFASFLFFLLLVILPDANVDSDVNLDEDDRKALEHVNLDSILTSNDSLAVINNNGMKWDLSSSKFKTIEAYDSAQQKLPEDQRDNWLERKMNKRNIELNKKFKDNTDGLGEQFSAFFTDNFSTALFFLMPFFALVLKLLYVRRDYFYSEHLVFTIYYYNFFYLAASLIMILNIIPDLETVSVLLGCWIYFYLLFAMKRVYAQGWGKTILKFGIFSFLFSILITLGIVVLALIALMTV